MAPRRAALLLALPSLCASAVATTYYVDPASGQMSNPGTATQPWSTLEAVFTANKTFAAGDVIMLKSGYHGAPTVKGNNSGNVTIQGDAGAVPKLRTLKVGSASHWTITGLDICPENAGAGNYLDTDLVEIQSSGSFITFRNNLVRGGFDSSAWTLANWQDWAGNGIRVTGPDNIVSNNRLENVGFGMRINRTALRVLVSRNTIRGFCMDGIQTTADDGVFEYNTISDSYVDDSNHDDFFQAWSSNTSGSGVGSSTIYRITLRGNTFISRTVPATILSTEPQGIGLFDGMFEGWVIENNLILTNTYHGISLYGAINCKVVNNTVVENPLNTTTGKRPWIQIYQHKNDAAGAPWPVLSSGNLIRNNISADTAKMVSGGGTLDHNQKVTAYSTWFTNPAAFDYTLKANSPGIGAGVEDSAPTIDLREYQRTAPYDLGAYEYGAQPSVQNPYQQWLIANNLPADGSGNGAPDANPSGDGVPNEIKFALGLPVNSAGFAGRMVIGMVTIDGKIYNTLSYTRPEPAPAGVSYVVEATGSLTAWSGTSVAELSNTVSGGLKTIVMRDVVPRSEGSPQRFIRLRVSK